MIGKKIDVSSALMGIIIGDNTSDAYLPLLLNNEQFEIFVSKVQWYKRW